MCLFQALLQALQRESSDLFPELGKSLDLTGTQVGELLSAHEAVFDGRVEGLVKSLEQDVAQLHHRSEELNRLAYMQDNISFLKVKLDVHFLFFFFLNEINGLLLIYFLNLCNIFL